MLPALRKLDGYETNLFAGKFYASHELLNRRAAWDWLVT
jgi:hypothetical protein